VYKLRRPPKGIFFNTHYPRSKMFKRFPSFPDIVPVYAVIVFMLFAWAILQFFWYLPS